MPRHGHSRSKAIPKIRRDLVNVGGWRTQRSDSKKFRAIVGSEYRVPHEVHFHIGRKRLEFEEYSFIVTGDNGKINWQIIMYWPRSYDSKFVVHDNEGKIIMTLKKPHFEFFEMTKYRAYKGVSTDEKDFLFSVERPRGFFWKCDLKGYLASTQEEKDGFDFEVAAFWLNRDFVVKQKGGHVLADGYFATNGWFCGSENFNVIVSPNVDYAFIVAQALIFFDSSTGSAKAWLDDHEDID